MKIKPGFLPDRHRFVVLSKALAPTGYLVKYKILLIPEDVCGNSEVVTGMFCLENNPSKVRDACEPAPCRPGTGMAWSPSRGPHVLGGQQEWTVGPDVPGHLPEGNVTEVWLS